MEVPLGDGEPIAFRRPLKLAGSVTVGAQPRAEPAVVAFNRLELNAILNVYGRKVASGEWRDYAIDMGRDRAVFSVFRRASEVPIYTIEKSPKLARKQGAFSIVTVGGVVLKRGHDLARVLAVFDSVRLVK
jgi:hypothetical protein